VIEGQRDRERERSLRANNGLLTGGMRGRGVRAHTYGKIERDRDRERQ
jgi:hypothetical protein